jgi:hypothetical protein
MFVLDRLLVGGIGFVLRRVAEAANAESTDDSALREELLAAQMKLELGEITEDEYVEIERVVLDALREIRGRTGAGAAFEAKGLRVEGVDADVGSAEPAPKKSGARRARRQRR